ncbi:MAG: sulfatase [Bacteroidota bacterium]
MPRPIFFLLLLLLSWTCQSSSSSEEQATSPPPNILWIVADDLGADLGCYGTPVIQTPNLDQFAQEAIRFTNFHTVTAVCSPSRSALITGRYPTSINCHQHRTQYKQPLPEGVQPITEYFREAGYFVSNGTYQNREKAGKTDYNFIHDSQEMYDGVDWSQRGEGQPFFAQVQVFIPHRPFLQDSLNPVDHTHIELPPYYPDHPIAKKDWAMYYETIQLMDRAVGGILKRLEEEGLADNTYVFFFGDQGRPHVRAKQFLYGPGTNSPFLLRYPHGQQAGTVSEQLISNIDLAPTAMNLANIQVPQDLPGMDVLAPTPQREYLITIRDRRDETVDRIRAVRNQSFSYLRNFYPERPWTQFNAYKKFRYPSLTLMEELYAQGELNEVQARFMGPARPAEELYDLKNDPFETHNLATDPAFQVQLEEMRQVLDEWLGQYDQGQYPEDASEIEFAEQLMEDRFAKNMQQYGLTSEATNAEILQYWEETFFGTKP